MTKDSTTTEPPSTSHWTNCFLGCFGGSGKKTRLPDEVNSRSQQRRRIFKWSLRFKKPRTKTVPVPTISETTWEIRKHSIMVKESHASVKTDENKIRRKKWAVGVKSQNGQQKETKPAATIATSPGLASPGQKSVTVVRPFVSSPLKPLTHSKSLPPPKRQKHVYGSSAGDGVDERVLGRTREFDSIIGMSIILVILVIIVLWGKLCAIICTSAWFFIAPRLVGIKAREHSSVDMVDTPTTESGNNLDLESVEYKKKVVLEGLLQRNHRSIVGHKHRKSNVNLE